MAYFTLYRDSVGEFRWNLRSSKNGNKIADSAEGYVNKTDALRGIDFLKLNVKEASLKDLT